MNQEDGHSSDGNSHYEEVEENGSTKTSAKTITDSQRRQLEEAFQKNHYDDSNTREVLASSLGLSMRQVQTWFQHRRNKWQRENQTMIERPSTSRVNQPSETTSVVPENPRSIQNIVDEDTFERVTLLRFNLSTERSKYTHLKKKYLKLRSKYYDVVADKNVKDKEIEKERLKNKQLTKMMN